MGCASNYLLLLLVTYPSGIFGASEVMVFFPGHILLWGIVGLTVMAFPFSHKQIEIFAETSPYGIFGAAQVLVFFFLRNTPM